MIRNYKAEEIKTAKSLYKEYRMLSNRTGHLNEHPAERAYHLRMINNVKAKINFSLLGNDIPENKEYQEYTN